MPHIDSFLTSLLLLLNLTLSLQDDKQRKSTHLHVKPNHEFVAGRTMEYLPDPIFYDTYIPIIYKIPIPKYEENALRLMYGNVQSCNSSSTKSGYLCPISYHLFQVTKKLADDMGFWKPYYVNHTSTTKESLKKRTGYEVLCNEISQHFFRSYTSKSQLNSYMTSLRACSRISFRGDFKDPNDDNWVVDKSIFYKMLHSFNKSYFNDLPRKGNLDWAIFLNTYTAVHGLLLTNHVMESVRLATAQRVCQSGLIPETFISMNTLRVALQDMRKNLTSRNYQLVYDNLEHDIEEYYKLPLADCTFSDNYTFIIRILAPVRRQEISHKLVEINTIPFLEALPLKSGIPTRLCRLKLSSPKFTLVETSTGLLLDTRCKSNQLCKTSEVSTVFENDACTTSLLTDDRRLITNTCKFSCFAVSSQALPLIQRVSPDTYVVVGSSDTKINLNCFTRPEELPAISLKNVGALRIKLACDCQLLYSDHVSYRPRDPCGGKTIVQHILPYHWYQPELNQTLDKYKLGTTTAAPTENDDSLKPARTERDDDEGSPGNNSTTPQSTGDIDDAQIEKSLEKQEEELGNEFGKRKHGVIFKKLSEIPDGLVIQLIMLWTLVMILLFVILVLGYHVYRLLKWKELQAYKETRVLYRPNENKIVNKL